MTPRPAPRSILSSRNASAQARRPREDLHPIGASAQRIWTALRAAAA